MADMTKLWLTVVTSMVLLLCVAAETDSGVINGCKDLCSQMALHLDFNSCMVECMVAVDSETQSDDVPAQAPPGGSATSSYSSPTKRRFVRIGRQVAPLRISERAANPFVRIGRTFVRIGRPQRRAVSSFVRTGKHWPYGKSDDVDGDRLSAKRFASFVRIGRSVGGIRGMHSGGGYLGGKRTSAFVRIGKRNPTDEYRAGELASLVEKLSTNPGEPSDGTESTGDGVNKRASPFVRIGRDPVGFAAQKRAQFIRIGRR